MRLRGRRGGRGEGEKAREVGHGDGRWKMEGEDESRGGRREVRGGGGEREREGGGAREREGRRVKHRGEWKF